MMGPPQDSGVRPKVPRPPGGPRAWVGGSSHRRQRHMRSISHESPMETPPLFPVVDTIGSSRKAAASRRTTRKKNLGLSPRTALFVAGGDPSLLRMCRSMEDEVGGLPPRRRREERRRRADMQSPQPDVSGIDVAVTYSNIVIGEICLPRFGGPAAKALDAKEGGMDMPGREGQECERLHSFGAHCLSCPCWTTSLDFKTIITSTPSLFLIHDAHTIQIWLRLSQVSVTTPYSTTHGQKSNRKTRWINPIRTRGSAAPLHSKRSVSQ